MQNLPPLSPIKEYALKNSVPIMHDEGIGFICGYIRAHGVKRVLEIGAAIGYSAVQFASAGAEVRVTTLEINEGRYLQALENVKSCGLSAQITVVLQDALEFETDEKFDLIFIDAAKAQYIKFFEKFQANLAAGGVIVSDNLSFHGMVEDFSRTHNYSTMKLLRKIRKYLSFLMSNPYFCTEFVEVGDRISLSRRREGVEELSFERLERRDEANVRRMAELEGGILRECFAADTAVAQNEGAADAPSLCTDRNPAAINEQLRRGVWHFFVLAPSGEAIGVLAFSVRGGQMLLRKFCLQARWRGKGFSRQMLCFAVAHAKAKVVHVVTVRAKCESSAFRVFKKIGFFEADGKRGGAGNGGSGGNGEEPSADECVLEYRL